MSNNINPTKYDAYTSAVYNSNPEYYREFLPQKATRRQKAFLALKLSLIASPTLAMLVFMTIIVEGRFFNALFLVFFVELFSIMPLTFVAVVVSLFYIWAWLARNKRTLERDITFLVAVIVIYSLIILRGAWLLFYLPIYPTSILFVDIFLITIGVLTAITFLFLLTERAVIIHKKRIAIS